MTPFHAMTLAPGEHVDTPDAFVVAISPINLTRGRFHPIRGGPGAIGDTRSALTNPGPAEARFVLLEFKP